MSSFGQKLAECRKEKGLSQSELAKRITTHYSIIGKYERNEVKPTIDVVKKLADNLETTVGYLLGETQDANLLKDPDMMRRFNEVNKLPENDKNCVFSMMDAYLAKHKMQELLK